MTRLQRLASRQGTLVGCLLSLVLLAGCSGLQGTDDANFVSGDGSIVQIDAGEREGPVEISGTSLQGEPVDLADLRGQVVVLNLWGSWCNPCRDEAPVLQEASEQIDAAFVGMSFREDSQDNARAFEREFSITYPTIVDEGTNVLALGRYAPRSPPSTYLLDTQGRIAAVFSGPVSSAQTLEDLVEEIADEDG